MKKNISEAIFFLAVTLFLAFFTILLLTSCSENSEVKGDKTRYFNQPAGIEYSTDSGFYYLDNSNFLKFFDYESKESVFVCSKPHCKHEQWKESTPEEERCHAYSPAMVEGFTNNEKLYLIQSSFGLNNTQVIESNLDRSEQRKICEFEFGRIAEFVVSDNKLILSVGTPQFEESEDGTVVQTHKTMNRILSINLNDGKVSKLSENEDGFNNECRILAATDSNLYLSYNYHKKPFDGTNFFESEISTVFYKVNIGTNEVKPIFQELDGEIASARINDRSMFAIKLNRDEIGNVEKMQIISIDLETEKIDVISDAMFSTEMFENLNPFIIGDSIYYKVNGDQGWYEYDTLNERTVHHENMNIDNHYIFADAGEYFYLNRQEANQESEMGFLKKEDVYNGNMDSFIPRD